MAILNTANLTSKIPTPDGGKVSVTTISNTQRINNMSTDLEIVMSAERTWAIPKDVLTITTHITNNLDVPLEDFRYKDTLTNAKFVKGTFQIGTTLYQEFDPTQGITMPVTLGALGSDMTVKYQIEVDQNLVDYEVSDICTITADVGSNSFDVNSNKLIVTVLENAVTLTKSANMSAVKSGDTITYTVLIESTGNFDNTELFFEDPIPAELEFVADSVKIDDVKKLGANPNDGFSLPDLNAGGQIKVEFMARVK